MTTIIKDKEAEIAATDNIVWHQHSVDKAARSANKQQQPCVLWFTGLSGSGKSTVAGALENELHKAGYHTYLLDGDNVRFGLCGDLGFSDDDRKENIRRVGEVAKLMVDAGVIVLTAFISPHRQERELVRSLLGDSEFIEIHVDADLATCELRDPKGLYKKARAGEIKNFTGIDSVYEAPEKPELYLDNGNNPVSMSVQQIMMYLAQQGHIK
ncbi:adenylyl-sulfate kinase [Moritella sp. Urea-trap-13]|uniref:adenylyl-sulfate kinase n=1 Tax=Moritella sp. Urea-trap-13 TaxID=2058327 RepID=UPI000C34FAFF|nr:adenylyl-sulfate kinase [Moritella sp. Urea-trap-13]PKH07273.1 adenylyl-sulfate kinase [Moritella sp. Urea-trap-13]